MARRIYAAVGGRVQNVGFRMFVLETARRLAVGGWVRNLPDGSVELEAEGEESAIQALLAAVRQGPPAARVREVQVEERAPTGQRGPFAVR